MLNVRMAYPFPGSYALYEGEGPQQPVRIVQRLGPNLVQISFVERPEASGYRSLPLDRLPNSDQLCPAEAEEMSALGIKLHGRKRPPARQHARRAEFDADSARYESLRQRSIRAPILDRLLDQHERREKARKQSPYFRRTAVYAPA